MDNAAAVTITVIALALAMDCFAVSITRGLETRKSRLKTALVIASSFGFFQAAMPLVGWYAGERFIGFVENLSRILAFIILSGIGLKMITESMKEEKSEIKPLNIPVLLSLSVATSMDALAAGLSIALLNMPVYVAAAIIGAASFILSLLGFYIGKKAGNRFGSGTELLGGVMLIAVGVKILI